MSRIPTFDNDLNREAACTGGLSPHLCRLGVHDLEIGMFVEELDKPWIESGFLLQGFFIKNLEQIQQLQSECTVVYINQSSMPDTLQRHADRRRRFAVISGGRG